MSIFNPPNQKFLTTNNPILRVLMINKNVVIQDEKYKDIIADIIRDVNYDFEPPPEFIEELSEFTEEKQTEKQTDNQIDDSSDNDSYNDSYNDSSNGSNTTSYSTGRFTTSYVLDIKNDQTATTEDDMDKHIRHFIKMRELKLKQIDIVLAEHNQLWNIIIPIYAINDGIKCPLSTEEYYYDKGTEYAHIGFDFILRNKGLFLEIIPTYDDTETWRTMCSLSPNQTLKTFGLSKVKLNHQHVEKVLTDNIKVTFVNIIDEPSTPVFGVWSCYNYGKKYRMKLRKDIPYQFAFRQVLASELDKYNKNPQTEFDKSEWSNCIKFNPIDNYINNKTDNIVSDAKKTYSTISKILSQSEIIGLSQMDIWTLLKECSFEAHIGKPNQTSFNYPSDKATDYIDNINKDAVLNRTTYMETESVDTDEEPIMTLEQQIKSDEEYAKKLNEKLDHNNLSSWEDMYDSCN
jgi:hypothetical protein